jgi:hypothetical protein
MTTSLRLGDLSEADAIDMLADLTGVVFAAPEHAARLAQLTHGNPLLVSIVANDAELRDAVRTGGSRSRLGPASVPAVVAGFLSRLERPSIAVLEAAAVVGRVFDPPSHHLRRARGLYDHVPPPTAVVPPGDYRGKVAPV